MELEFFRRQPNLDNVIELAAFARTSDDKRHPHHQRRRQSTLDQAFAALSQLDFAECLTFDALHDAVREAIGEIHGIGALFVYDAALSIGAFLRLEPDKVYLHAGARRGARALGIERRPTVEPHELPRAFGRLRPHEIEDCLCLYAGEIEALLETAR